MMLSLRASNNNFRTLCSALLVASCRCFSASSASSRTTTKVSSPPKVPPENVKAISSLEPAAVWSQFAAISSIPRPSKHEDAVLAYIKNFADERKLPWKQDAVGNLVVFHPGSLGGKNAPAVILQGHVDMVTEKNAQNAAHDFLRDPIRLKRFQTNNNDDNGINGETTTTTWIGARGTTLGADNGIGVAAALALLDTPASEEETAMTATDSTKSLPPLEALFTVDEETGLTGAMELDATALGLTGKTMLNLDTEEWGELYVGCAGGGESVITYELSRSATAAASTSTSTSASSSSSSVESQLVEVCVDGLMGGHSGINIHEGRANAILLCAGTAQAVLQKASSGSGNDVSLVSITGGDKHNAIPREAKAVFAVSSVEGRKVIDEVVAQSFMAAKAEYGTLETNLHIYSTTADVEGNDNGDGDIDIHKCQAPLDPHSANGLLAMVLALPHGPLKYSHVMPDLVETSNNVASLSMDASTATILCSTRSSISSALESARNKISSITSLAGSVATIKQSPPYPGWNPNLNSPLLKLAKEQLLQQQQQKDRSPGIKAIHAGLECGLLIEKLGGDVDVLSFGPTIQGAHSPDERIDTDTVLPFFNFVKDILAELAKKQR